MAIYTDQEKIQMLADLIALKTVNGDEMKMAKYLQAVFERHGIDCEIMDLGDNRANLIATMGQGRPVVAFSGHMDVVDAGNLAQWKFDPFTLTEEAGKLYGRGTGDMLAGLLDMVFAMIEIQENGWLEQGTLQLLATSAEESSQIGSRALYESGAMDEVEALIIAEPTGDVINYAHKGSMNFKVKSEGRSAHSSIPMVGQDAIQPLLTFISRLKDKFQALNQSLDFQSFDFGPAILNFGGIEGDEAHNQAVEAALKQAVLTNTLIDGGSQINSVADYAEASFNGRTTPEFTNQMMIQLFDETIQEVEGDLSYEILLDLDSVMTHADNRLVRLAKEIGEKRLGKSLIVCPTTGVTDASNLLKGKDESFDLIVFGPGITKMAHQANEYVVKADYLAFVDYFVELVLTYMNEA